MPSDPESLRADHDRENLGRSIFGALSLGTPGEIKPGSCRDFAGRSDVLVAILDTFGQASAGWSLALIRWLETNFAPGDFEEFGYDRPFMVDQLIDCLACPNFDPKVADWFCDRYLEYTLDALSDEQVRRIRETATAPAREWARFIVEQEKKP